MDGTPVILAIALSPSVDVAYEVDGLVFGGVSRPLTVTRVAGGKALNVARVARTLGAEVRVVAVLGGHSGRWIADQLHSAGIGLDVIETASETRTCLAITDLAAPGTTSTDLYERSVPVTHREWLATTTVVEAAASTAATGYAVIAGSIPAGVPLDELTALVERVRASGFRIVLDTSGHALGSLIPTVDLVKINRSEAEELIGRPLRTAEAACRALHTRWGVDAIVTDGIRGSAALVGGESVDVEPPTHRGAYPVGSGDSYLAGLVATLDRGASLTEALRAAAGVAERNAQIPGPGLLAPVMDDQRGGPGDAGQRGG